MSADTLTDAETRVLRLATRGRLVFGLLLPDEQRLIIDMQRRGWLGGPPFPGITPAGREALAAHEAAEHPGSRWVAPGEVDRPQVGMDGQVIEDEIEGSCGDVRGDE